LQIYAACKKPIIQLAAGRATRATKRYDAADGVKLAIVKDGKPWNTASIWMSIRDRWTCCST
jgi:hypothetical protein